MKPYSTMSGGLIWNDGRIDGPAEISLDLCMKQKVWFTDNRRQGWHRTDGHAFIRTYPFFDETPYRLWLHNNENVKEEVFLEMGIDPEDMTEEEVLIVQMRLLGGYE